MKIAILVIGIVIIGALFVLQDFGSQRTSEPVQRQPTQSQQVQSQPTSQPTQTQPTQSQQVQSQNQCDPSYPTLCIPPNSPDLDCDEITSSNFRVIPPDPHGFDGDKDGIGCES